MNKRMELVQGYTISPVINGCWQLSEGHSLKSPLDYEDVMKALTLLAEKGFTTFDCADIYTGVEEFLGKFLAQLKNHSTLSPQDIQIHTKYVPDMNLLAEINYDYTEKIIDRSLQRLGRDTLDLVQFHWWDYGVPGYVETAQDLARLQKKGKIRNIGVTNFDTDHFREIVEAGVPIASFQTQYSFFDRRPEKGLAAYCHSQNIPLLCYGTLCGGLLSEKWRGKSSADPETRSQIKYLQVIEDSLGWQGYQQLLDLLADIAGQQGVEIPHIAAKYILDKPEVGGVIIGVRNSSHVQSNEKLFGFDLTPHQTQQIDDFLAPFPILPGEPFELERTEGSKYRNIMKMNLNEK